MNRLLYLKEAPKDEIEAIKLYHKRMGRDALWDILEVLNDAEVRLTQKEISEKITRKNIGTDLRFLAFIDVIDRIYVNEKYDHTFSYAISYNAANKHIYQDYHEYNILQCDLSNQEKRQEFIKQFKPKKRKISTKTKNKK